MGNPVSIYPFFQGLIIPIIMYMNKLGNVMFAGAIVLSQRLL